VGELRQLASRAGGVPAEPIEFPSWNRSLLARALRRVALPLVLLPLLRIFVWLRVKGRENLRGLEAPVVFAANHQSVFDVPTLLAAMPSPWRYRVAPAMGMDWFRPHFHPERYSAWERFGNSLQYYLVCLFFNGFPLPVHEAGAREALRYMGELAGERWSVLIFPEGIRTKAGEIAPFRPGVGMMGSRLNLRVVPVRMEGLERVLHEAWFFPRPGRVRVTWGRAIELKGEDYGALAKKVEEAVRELGE
jgi:long-chain acyl-CoA synthetase